ncbi:putative Ig domain-containing protein [Lysobacter brunescens]|uniref:Ig domain-containing protein n=1 Tax=Lysobacter brunescens TaxID=262323 RepID=A0ABW2YE01_9GAMM
MESDLAAFVAANPATAQATRTVYDMAGRATYTVDGVGGYIQYRHDDADRVVAVRKAATALNLSAITDATTVEQLSSMVVASASDEHVRYLHDRAGRVAYTIDATGASTRVWHDGAGRILGTRTFATRLSTANLEGLTDATTVQELDALQVQNASDALSYQVHDAVGQVRYTVQMTSASTASVRHVRYDGVGRAFRQDAYTTTMTIDPVLASRLMDGTAVDADFASFVSANASTAHSMRTVYDAAGNAVFSVDATGAVARSWYDGAGRMVASRRFATRLDTAGLGDESTAAQLDTMLVFSDQDQGTFYRVYNAAGQLRYTVDMTSASTAVLAEMLYDGVGRQVLSRAYGDAMAFDSALAAKLVNGLTIDSDFASFVTANESSARTEAQVYDASGRVRFALQRNFSDWSVSERNYDGAGRTTSETRYGAPIAYTPGQEISQLSSVLAGQADSRTTRYVYDAAGQLRFVLDPTGALSERRYDAIGQVVETRSYGLRPGAGVNVDLNAIAEWANTQVSSNVRKVTTAYDVAGRLVTRTDALNNSEIFTYDGTGRMLSRTDRAGAIWTYQYDAAGRKTAEISPEVMVYGITTQGALSAASRPVVTRYVYDALGQVASKTEDADNASSARTTSYAYDRVGRLVKTTLPHPGSIDPGTGNLVFNGPAPTVEITYDALGNAVVQKDANNHYSYKVYDGFGRVQAEVDAERNVTTYQYNAYGEQIMLQRYAARLDTGVVAFSGANWQAGQAISSSQISAGVNAVDPLNRQIHTVYNRLGQKAEVTLSAVDYRNLDNSSIISSGTPTTRYEYNAYGEVVHEKVLVSGSTDPNSGGGFWAETYRYYDQAGRMTHVVDAEGYMTAMQYNATGEVLKTIEYARAVAVRNAPSHVPGAPVLSHYSGTLGLSTSTPPTAPAAGDAASGYDRETQWTYDVLGRKASETMVRHVRAVDGNVQRQLLSSQYGYDAEDRVTVLTNAAGTTTTTYNALGQVTSVREPARQVLTNTADAALQANSTNNLASSSLYELRSPYTTMAYDGLGRVIATRRHANGHDGLNPPAIDDARDQVMLSVYDALDRVVMTQSASGWNSTTPELHRTYSAYDANGNLLHSWSRLEGSTDSRDTMIHRWYTYDAAGRQLSTRVERTAIGSEVTVGTDQHEIVAYNAFGEILSKSYAGVVGALTYAYDNAGRMVSDNSTGAIRKYAYNLAGQQTRESHWIRLDTASAAVEASTTMIVDGLGRTTKVVLPTHTTDLAAASTVLQTHDRWGNVVRIIDARGYQTDYEYNDQNQLVKETRPLVWVVAENGAGSWQRPVHYRYHDAQGRLVGMRDANGNLRQYTYDVVGQQVSMTDGTGNITRQAYDIFGQQRMVEDALGHITWQAFDRAGRVTSIGDFMANGAVRSQHVLQSYSLNQNGDRLATTNALNATAKYDYDSQGRMIRSQTAMNVVQGYAYDVQGRKVLETNHFSEVNPSHTDRDNKLVRLNALSWEYDAFGRVIDHNNLSARDSNYEYDPLSGMLMSETVAGGFGLMTIDPVLNQYVQAAANGQKTYTYYANGRIRTITESGGSTSRYEYDAAGNRTVEEVDATDRQGTRHWTVTRTTYDSNNRVLRVVQDDMAVTPSKRIFDLRYDYDANGNRRRVQSTSGYGNSVTPVGVSNAGPVLINPPRDSGVRPGEISQIRLLFSDIFRDPENDALSLTITLADGSPLPSWLRASRDAQTGEIVLVASPPAGAQDSEVVVKLTAFETANSTNTISTTFTVKVRQNMAPEARADAPAIPAAIVGQAFLHEISPYAHFIDLDVNESLTLSAHGVGWPAWLQVETVGGRLRLQGTPPSEQSYTFVLRATDSRGAHAERSVTINAAAYAGPAVVAPPAPIQATVGHGMQWSKPLGELFSGGLPLQITATGLPSWMAFDRIDLPVPTLRLQGTVPPAEAGGNVYNIQLHARDANGGSVSTTLVFTVRANPAPVAQVSSLALPEARLNIAYDYTVPLSSLFIDPEGEAFALRYLPDNIALSTWLMVSVNHTAGTVRFHGTPTGPSQLGSQPFTLKAIDAALSNSTIAGSILVRDNNAPMRSTTALPDQALSIGRSFSFTLPSDVFVDADGDAITILPQLAIQESEPDLENGPNARIHHVDLQALPAWISYDASTRTFTGTVPSNQAAGSSITIRLAAWDNTGRNNAISEQERQFLGAAGQVNDRDIVLNFQAWSNTAPQYVNGKLTNQTLVHGGAVDLPLPSASFVEPDGDPLSYSAEVQIGGNWIDISQIGLSIDAVTGRISGTATNLIGSTIQARILARDPQGGTGVGQFAFDVTNTPPTVQAIPAQSVGRNVDWNFPLSSFFSDVNSDALTYSVSGLPPALSLNSSTGTITGMPTVALGSYSVTVTASDGRGGTASTSFTLQVVNSSPVPASIGGQTATAGGTWSFQAPAFTDPNNDTLTYTASGLPSWMNFTAGNRTFSGTPSAVGSWTITLTATDTAGVSASTSFTVSTPNTAPQATTIAARTIGRNQAWSLATAAHFSDANGDALSYTATGLPSGLSIDAATGLISGTPSALGTFSVTVTASDGRGGTASATFAITVSNTAPLYTTTLPNRSAQAGSAVSWALPANTFTDANGDTLTYALWVQIPAHEETYWNAQDQAWDVRNVAAQWVQPSNAGLSIAANGTISGTLGALSASGKTFYNYQAKIVASDPTGATAEGTFAVHANAAPTAPSVTTPVAKQNLGYSFALPAFTDANDDTLTYSVSNLPPGLSFTAATRTISGTPTTAGNWAVSYSAHDGLSTSSVTFTLGVEANTPPSAPTVLTQTATQNGSVWLVLPAFTDPNGDGLIHSVSNLPPGLSFRAQDRTISGTATTQGSWTVTYSATDGRGGTASTTFVFSVAAPVANRAPVYNNTLQDHDATYGLNYQFPANAFTDPDGNTLSYTASGLPAWMSFNAGDRRFTGTPPTGAAFLSWTITVTAHDTAGLTASGSFTVWREGASNNGWGGGETEGALYTSQSYSFDMGMEEYDAGDYETGPVYGTPESTTESGGGEGGAAPPPSTPIYTLPTKTKDQWFTYDAENRMTIVAGRLVGTAGAADAYIEVVPELDEATATQEQKDDRTDSYMLTYNAIGQVSVRYHRDKDGHLMQTVTAYDQRGQRTYEFHEQRVGGDYKGIAKEFRYDEAGQIIATRSRFALGEKRWTIVPPESSGDGLVSEEVNVGGWLDGAENMQYDADGRALLQATYQRGMNGRQNVHPDDGDQYNDVQLLRLISRVDYTEADGTNPAWNDFDLSDNASAYDEAGRLKSYRYSSTQAINGDLPYTHTFTMTYEGWGSWQEREVYGTSTNEAYRNTVNRISFDAWGRIVHQGQHTYKDGVHDQIRVYTYTGDGMVHSRRDGWWDGRFKQLADKPQNFQFVHSGGKQVAQLQAGGGMQVSLLLERPTSGEWWVQRAQLANGKVNAFTKVNGTAGQGGTYSAGGGMVAVLEGEDLQAVSQRVYGSSRYWYVLAEANGLTASAALTPGLQLRAPEVSVTANDANTFKPYNPNEAIGPTSPSLPYIPDANAGGCSTAAMIVMLVIAIVVCVFVPVLAPILGPYFGGAAITTGVLAYSGATIGSVMAAGFIAGAAGSAIGQGINSVTGNGSFSWRQVAVDGITTALSMGVAYGLPSVPGLGKTVADAAGESTRVLNGWGRMAAAAINYAGKTAANKIAGMPTSFSWKAMAASVVGSSISGAVGTLPTPLQSAGFGSDLVGGFIDGSINLHVRRAFGFDDKVDYAQIFGSAFANAAGNAIGRAINGWRARRAEDRIALIQEHSAAISNDISTKLQNQFNDEHGTVLLQDGELSDQAMARIENGQTRLEARFARTQAEYMAAKARAEAAAKRRVELQRAAELERAKRLQQTNDLAHQQYVFGLLGGTPRNYKAEAMSRTLGQFEEPAPSTLSDVISRRNLASISSRSGSGFSTVERSARENVIDWLSDSKLGEYRLGQAAIGVADWVSAVPGQLWDLGSQTTAWGQYSQLSGLYTEFDQYGFMGTSARRREQAGRAVSEWWSQKDGSVQDRAKMYLDIVTVVVAPEKILARYSGVAKLGKINYLAGAERAARAEAMDDFGGGRLVGGTASYGRRESYGQIFEKTEYFSPTRDLPDDIPAAIDRAIELSNKYGAEIDRDLLRFVAVSPEHMKRISDDAQAFYGPQTSLSESWQLNQLVEFDLWPGSRTLSVAEESGMVNVYFSRDVLRSDARTIAVFTHEAKEVKLVAAEFERVGRMSLADYDVLTTPKSSANAHGAAVKAGDYAVAKYLLENNLVTKEKIFDLFKTRYF